MKQNKGITLVALVVTIILLIILASVAINIVINGGLIWRTQEASFKMEVQGLKEATLIDRASIDLDNILGENIEIPELEEVISKKFDGMFVMHEGVFKIRDTASSQEIEWCADINIPLFIDVSGDIAFSFMLEVPNNNKTVVLDVSANQAGVTNDFTIYWDYKEGKAGIGEKFSSPTSNPTHTYSSAGTYMIAITGTMSNGICFTNENRLTRILTPFSEGDLGITRMNYDNFFKGCANLKSIPENLFPNIEKTGYCMSFENTFNGCKNLESIPENLFEGMQVGSFANCFTNCSKIKTIPGNLFKDVKIFATANYEIQMNFFECFKGCINLETVEVGLFSQLHLSEEKNISRAEYIFQNIFYECTKLSSLSVALFSDLPLVDYVDINANFQRAFYGCTSLREVPEDMFSYMFYGLSSGNFLQNLTIDFSSIFSSSGIEIVPQRLFSQIYYRDPSWEWRFGGRIPDILLSYNGAFENCNSLRMIAPVDADPARIQSGESIQYAETPFNNESAVQSFAGTFFNCTNLNLRSRDQWEFGYEYRNQASSLRFTGKVVSFAYAFEGCVKITEIPDNKMFSNIEFAKNYSATESGFYSCFRNCESLYRLPPLMFENITFVKDQWNIEKNDFESCFEGCFKQVDRYIMPSGQIPGDDNYSVEGSNYENLILFGQNNAEKFNECFANSGLESIPVNLFERSLMAKDFTRCFANSGLQADITGEDPYRRGDIIKFWEWSNAHELVGNGCYEGCYEIQGLETIPEAWRVYTYR